MAEKEPGTHPPPRSCASSLAPEPDVTNLAVAVDAEGRAIGLVDEAEITAAYLAATSRYVSPTRTTRCDLEAVLKRLPPK